MKRVMAFLFMLMLVVPFASVRAITGNYYVYGKGDQVNFYYMDGDTTGISTIVLEDEGANSQYVKVLALAGYVFLSCNDNTKVCTGSYAEAINEKDGKPSYVQSPHKALINSTLNGFKGRNKDTGDTIFYAKDIDVEGNFSYVTKDELVSALNAKLDAATNTYSIDVTKGTELEDFFTASSDEFMGLLIPNKTKGYDVKDIKGFYTSSYKDGKVWVAEYSYDADMYVNKVTIKEVDIAATEGEYGYLPVVNFDKTYDCTEREAKDPIKNEACYSCDDEYIWTEVGTQADVCTLVDTVTTRDKCVKGPKTGVEEYILEFAGVAAVCVIALVIAKRKDLFRSI